MEKQQIELDLKPWLSFLAYLSSIFILGVSVYFVFILGPKIWVEGEPFLIFSLFLYLFLGIAACLSIYYFYNSSIVIDEEKIRQYGFSTVDLPFSATPYNYST